MQGSAADVSWPMQISNAFHWNSRIRIPTGNPRSAPADRPRLLRLLVLVLNFVPLRAPREQPVRRSIRRGRGWRHSGRLRAQPQFLQRQRIQLTRGAQPMRRLIFPQCIGSGSVPLTRRHAIVRAIRRQLGLNLANAIGRRRSLPLHAARSFPR